MRITVLWNEVYPCYTHSVFGILRVKVCEHNGAVMKKNKERKQKNEGWILNSNSKRWIFVLKLLKGKVSLLSINEHWQ